jgi:hypothetical protein
MDSSDGAVPVMPDAQFTTTRLLRPYADYEDDYQGVSTRIPIMMTEDGIALDDQAIAGTTGYAATLLRGIDVPLGSQIQLWLPKINLQNVAYLGDLRWLFVWRLRNLFDYRQNRKPWHVPRQGQGGGNNVIIAAADHVITYLQAEPVADFVRSAQNVYIEDTRTLPGGWGAAGTGVLLPLIPGGATGTISQGFGAVGVLQTDAPMFWPYRMQALGDELLVGLYRYQALDVNWNFAGNDAVISDFFDISNDVGVYVLSGTGNAVSHVVQP